MSFGILFGLFVKVFGLLTLISTASCQFPNEVEKAQLLETHHDARENVYPPASNMMLLLYSSHLEQLADYWASRCRFEHPDWSQYPHYHGLGQNIAAVGGFKPAFTEAVCGWRDEEKYYSYFNNSCTHICGHYTQMVWANTKWIGCAMRRCDGMRADWNNPQYFTVCQYKTACGRHNFCPGRADLLHKGDIIVKQWLACGRRKYSQRRHTSAPSATRVEMLKTRPSRLKGGGC
ncbi:GLIPR1-like protein 1 [Echinococcus granulosus]|nr:GLIPR1-like protein 1 [Echinococcus granulosus]